MVWQSGRRINTFFEELTRVFGARFLTCTRVLRPLDSLLSMSMREGETLKIYSDRYWELYNEIDGDFEVGLLMNLDLWKSLTMKTPRNVHQLMNWIEGHKRVVDNQSSTRGKSKVSTNDWRDNSGGQFSSSQPRREYYNQSSHGNAAPQMVNSVFKESKHQILHKIRHKPYFNGQTRWWVTPLK